MPQPPGVFVTTRWTRVLLAGNTAEPSAQEALAGLCHDYWRPLFHFALRKGRSREDAQDLTQGFIAQLLERNDLARADRDRGKFRTFLLTAFSSYLIGDHRRRAAQKRGGKEFLVSMDDEEGAASEAVPDPSLTPEKAYEQSWAFSMLDRIGVRLREEYLAAGRTELFEALRPHLTGAKGRPGYEEIGAPLGMSVSAMTSAMHRMRRRFGELLREEVAATVERPEEIEEELRYLIQVVSNPAGAA